MTMYMMTLMSNICESGHLLILQIPKFYNLSSYSLLSFLDAHSLGFPSLILVTWTLKKGTMTVLREDKSNLGRDPCGSVQNSVPMPGKVAGGHDLSCGGGEPFAEWIFILSCFQQHRPPKYQILHGSPSSFLFRCTATYHFFPPC